ncbi:uncharacterized protein [Lolium perenne]|uniref:uncharacterized protein isoform X3 n=1 Tax=Lolium perenne TaxID=4522 RepID=UPI003A9901C7
MMYGCRAAWRQRVHLWQRRPLRLHGLSGLFLIGLATKSSIFRGTIVVAIVGTLVFREVVDSIWLWRSLKSEIWSILYASEDGEDEAEDNKPVSGADDKNQR